MCAPPFVAADRERTEGIAVIALAAGNEEVPVDVSLFNEVLPRQFERSLDGLRPAAHEQDLPHSGGVGHQLVGKGFHDVRGEERGVRIGKFPNLRPDRLDHGRMTVPETGHGRTAAGIEVAIAVGVHHVDAFTARGTRGNLEQTAV